MHSDSATMAHAAKTQIILSSFISNKSGEKS